METFIRFAIAAAAFCAGCGIGQAAEQLTANTLRLAEGEASPAASIAEMAWLAGAWSGSGLE